MEETSKKLPLQILEGSIMTDLSNHPGNQL